MKRIAATNASMGKMSTVWDDDDVDTYLKYLLLKAIPCNLLLWGCKSWALRKYLLDSLKVFLHREIRRILKIRMSKVIKQHITNTSIGEKFYNIPRIKKQIALRQLTYLGKIFRREELHIPTHLLILWCDHQRKSGRPILTNKQSMVKNIQQVIPSVDSHGTISTWGFHAPGTQHSNDLLNNLRHPPFNPPENDPNKPQEDNAPPPKQTRRSSITTPPPTQPPHESDIPKSPHHRTSSPPPLPLLQPLPIDPPRPRGGLNPPPPPFHAAIWETMRTA